MESVAFLDYAAENDIHPGMSKQDNDFPGTSYDYESEAACDVHVEAFRSCIRSVAKVAPDGFAALKVTALGNPKLLERMSHALKQAEKLFFQLGHKPRWCRVSTRIQRWISLLLYKC